MAAATTMTEKMGGTTMGGFITAVGIPGCPTKPPMLVGATISMPILPMLVGLKTPMVVVTPCRTEGIQSREGSSGEREHRETRDRATTIYMYC